METVTVSIVTYSEVESAKACIASVRKHTPEVKLILTANGNPEAAAYFATVPNATVIVHPANLGFGRAHNRAFEKCSTEFFLCLNDDVVVGPGWLDSLMQPFVQDSNAALSCPEKTCSQLLPTFHGSPGRREYCEGSCLLIRCSVAKRLGLFDETLPGLAYGEDSDLSLRYRQSGYTLHWRPVNFTHAGARTSGKMPEVRRWQDDNHRVLRVRWAHYLKVRRFDHPIVLKRHGAHGDVLLLTPVIKALRESRPQCPIYVETAVADVFLNNPHVTKASSVIPRMPNEHRIMLDGCYEANPDQHFVKSYAERCGVKIENTCTQIFANQNDCDRMKRNLGEGTWVAVHAGPSNWPGKEWEFSRFAKVCEHIRAKGMKVFLVGSGYHDKSIPNDLDLRGKTSVSELAAAMYYAKMALTLDSFPMHVAQAVGTPVVALFGVTLPGPIFTDGSLHLGVKSDPKHPSSGIRHRIKGRTSVSGNANPTLTITVEQVIEAVDYLLKLIDDDKPNSLPLNEDAARKAISFADETP